MHGNALNEHVCVRVCATCDVQQERRAVLVRSLTGSRRTRRRHRGSLRPLRRRNTSAWLARQGLDETARPATTAQSSQSNARPPARA